MMATMITKLHAPKHHRALVGREVCIIDSSFGSSSGSGNGLVFRKRGAEIRKLELKVEQTW